MSDISSIIKELSDHLDNLPEQSGRHVVAIAGAPASGKSTLAERLASHLNRMGRAARVVPMDGFHLDNAILERRGILDRKGSPDSFDSCGFLHLVKRLKKETDVVYPIFDRSLDLSIAGAGHLDADCRTVIVEGNYLLYDAPVWRDLANCWDLSVFVDVDPEILKSRLIDRWLSFGLTPAQAIRRAEGNDMPNARLIQQYRLPADLTL